MADSVFNQPTPEQLDGFVIGDPIAIDEVVRLLLPQLYRWAITKYHNLPEDEILSTLHLVLAEACRNHAHYAPRRSKLTTYLIWLLKLRLNDLYHDITDYAGGLESDVDIHENLLQMPYNGTSTVDINTRLARDIFFQDAALLLEAHERDFLELMRRGEKHQQAFVAVLDHHGQSTTDPEHDVKNAKERLIRKLKTLAKDQGYELQDLLGE